MQYSVFSFGIIGRMLLAGCNEPPANTAPARPNIILIMSDDMGYSDEMNNLSEEFPERVNEMNRMWDEYAQRTGVFPAPWGE